LALGQGPINSIRVATCPGHEGAAFAACYSGAIVRIAPDGREARAHALHDGAVKALRLHPRAALGVSCSADGGLLSWTLDGEIVHRFPGHTAIVDDVDIAPAGDRIASASRDFTLNVYDLADARLIQSIELGRRSPKSLCFWDAETVIVGDYWGALVKVDLATGGVTRRTVAANGLSSLTRCGEALVATSYDGGVYRVSVHDLDVTGAYRAMTQRLVPATAVK
jgi:WD40 repeat protein